MDQEKVGRRSLIWFALIFLWTIIWNLAILSMYLAQRSM